MYQTEHTRAVEFIEFPSVSYAMRLLAPERHRAMSIRLYTSGGEQRRQWPMKFTERNEAAPGVRRRGER
jgi:hypothetical protein